MGDGARLMPSRRPTRHPTLGLISSVVLVCSCVLKSLYLTAPAAAAIVDDTSDVFIGT